jgi:hypothetical protein
MGVCCPDNTQPTVPVTRPPPPPPPTPAPTTLAPITTAAPTTKAPIATTVAAVPTPVAPKKGRHCLTFDGFSDRLYGPH